MMQKSGAWPYSITAQLWPARWWHAPWPHWWLPPEESGSWCRLYQWSWWTCRTTPQMRNSQGPPPAVRTISLTCRSIVFVSGCTSWNCSSIGTMPTPCMSMADRCGWRANWCSLYSTMSTRCWTWRTFTSSSMRSWTVHPGIATTLKTIPRRTVRHTLETTSTSSKG